MTTPKFNIRKLTPEEVQERNRASSPENVPEPVVPPPPNKPNPRPKPKGEAKSDSKATPLAAPVHVAPVLPDRLTSGVLFRSGARMFSFLGVVAGSGLASDATLMRGPDEVWWTEIRVSPEHANSIAQASGGRTYSRVGNQWFALNSIGEVLDPSDLRNRFSTSALREASMAELVSELALRERRYAPCNRLDIVVPSALTAWAVRRLLANGLVVQVAIAERRPLVGDGPESSMVVLRVSSDRNIPSSLVYSFSSQPYTAILQVDRGEHGCVMFDVRQSIAMPLRLLSEMIPEDETWLIGLPEFGRWRLRFVGAEVPGESLLDSPPAMIAETMQEPKAPTLPRIDVRLVPRRGDGRVDGLLLDDRELGWMQSLMCNRMMTSLTFVIPGPGQHLLVAPGGFMDSIPLGLPLRYTGPTGLYVQSDQAFYPALPAAARQMRYQLDASTVVIVTETGVVRVRTEDLRPVWSLWLGESPAINTTVSPTGALVLARLSAKLRELAAIPVALRAVAGRSAIPQAHDDSTRTNYVEQAMREQLQGNLVRAAELLEAAGHHGPAGRLYEQAAMV